MATKEKELEEIEALFYDRAKEPKWKWALVPTPIRALAGAKKRAEFVKAVLDSRVTLLHTDWRECAKDARQLSETGGVEMVSIITMKPTKVNIVDSFVNGSSSRSKRD